MMLNDCQQEMLHFLTALGHRVRHAEAGSRLLVWLDDNLYLMDADGSLGPEVNCD